jgi:hypothetical protein
MNEFEPLTIERLDDVPVLLAQLEHMQVAKLLDQHFPTPGNWQGLSLGMVSGVWLSQMLSEGDHWLNHVEPWAEQHLTCLQACLGQEVRSLDFSDDRLLLFARWLPLAGSANQFTSGVSEESMECSFVFCCNVLNVLF